MTFRMCPRCGTEGCLLCDQSGYIEVAPPPRRVPLIDRVMPLLPLAMAVSLVGLLVCYAYVALHVLNLLP
jgi:hypothetical protein